MSSAPSSTMFHSQVVLREWQLLDALVQNKSKPIILTGLDLAVPQVVYVARYGGSAESRDIKSLNASVDILERKLNAGEIIYGVNTGFGGSADTRTNQPVQLQVSLVQTLRYGVLPRGSRDPPINQLVESFSQHRFDFEPENGDGLAHLPWSWTRATVLIRINSLIKGVSAVRPVVINRLHDLLEHDLVPMIPLRGSISASGDLSPLAYVAATICGKSTARVLSKDGQSRYADTAFRKAGLEPITLQPKEGLAIVNGTAASAAAGALVIHDAHSLAILAQVLTAMSVEALLGTAESFHPFFAQVRPHPGQIESSQNILAFLKGSLLTQENDGSVEAILRQDRYSIRTAPQWIGPVLEDFVLAHQQISIELNSATDNPLVTPEGEFLHGGNFQAKAVTSAMEKVRQGLQSIGRMLFCQCTEMINPSTSHGLPPNLVADDPSTSFIFKGVDIGIAALQAELGFLANPVGNHVQTAEMGNQALNSLALISARYTHTSNEILSQLMASHLLAACQALDLRAMHLQFLDQYRPVFFALVAAKYAVSADTPPGTPSDTGVSPSILDGLTATLWSQLQTAFDATVNLDAHKRFPRIAKSLRTVWLDHASLVKGSDFLQNLEEFTSKLAFSLEDAWRLHRDAYLVHGDATPYLGMASKKMYAFVRTKLNVPILSVASVQASAPEMGALDAGRGEAQDVGSYAGVLYRAFRDGTFAKLGMDILGEARA